MGTNLRGNLYVHAFLDIRSVIWLIVLKEIRCNLEERVNSALIA